MMGSVNLVQPGSDRMTISGFTGYEGWDLDDLQRRLNMRIGKGFVGWVARERKAAWADNVREDPRWDPVPGIDDAVGSALGAPILVEGNLLGVLVVFHRDTGVFEQEHLDLLVAICGQVALAWSNAQRYRQIDRRLAELTVLQQAAQVINQRMEMQPLLEEVVEQVRALLGYTYVGISLVEDQDLVLMARRGHEGGKLRFSIMEGITGRVVRTNQPALVPDVDRDPDFVRYFPESRSELAVPIRKGELVIGVLNVESPVLDGLTREDLRLLLLLADQLAVAIENAALYERLRRHSADLETTVASRTAELAKALERAQAADRLKTQFVSDVSHELRTPLSNIRLYVELLRQAPPARHPDYIDTLERETERLVTLIEDLLSISRLDAGSVPAVLNRVDLNTMARALVEDRQKLFSERGLELDVTDAGGEAPVMADENLMAQVIGNLMTNAMHYTPSGGRVTLQTRVSDDGQWVTFSVIDTGLGILPEEQASLFDRFFRGSASRTMGNPGTGLGLAISKEIVGRHGGRIEVSSTPGQGSTMTIWLPAVRPSEFAGTSAAG
jgi:signal transduction histidine kinase